MAPRIIGRTNTRRSSNSPDRRWCATGTGLLRIGLDRYRLDSSTAERHESDLLAPSGVARSSRWSSTSGHPARRDRWDRHLVAGIARHHVVGGQVVDGSAAGRNAPQAVRVRDRKPRYVPGRSPAVPLCVTQHLLAQLALHQFSGRGARQLRQEADLVGHLERCQVVLGERDQLGHQIG